MGLRCSLFGHTFSETDTRRDREVRGDEVVTVVKTVERCGSCGAERVVSENKEVVSVVEADDIGEAEVAATETEGTETGDSADPEATDQDAAETAASEEAGGVADETDADPDPDEPVEAPDLDPDADPDEEDVEFITETDGSLGGGDEVDVDPDEEAPEGGIGGMAARSGAYGDSEADDPVPDTGDEAADEDAEILGEDERPADRAPGQWPDDPDATDEPWEPGELGGGPGTEPEPNEEVPEPAPVEPSPAPGKAPEGDGAGDRLRCPGCGHTVPLEGSYRAGDACPECRSDYLEAASE
jgi:uncharacterized protein (DUF983 family)